VRSLHVLTGSLALLSGAVALYAWKGGRLHRRSGMLFVCVMLIASATAAVMAARRPNRIGVVGGVLGFYLVSTALLTVRRPARGALGIDAAAMLLGASAAIAGVHYGFAASISDSGRLDGVPAAPAFVLGGVGLLAAAGDIRMLLASGIHGNRRIARHLWRMGLAMVLAVGSSYLGRPELFPNRLRDSGLLWIPMLAVVSIVFYWLARLHSYRRATIGSTLVARRAGT
jgi:uncharacterized membrane protein